MIQYACGFHAASAERVAPRLPDVGVLLLYDCNVTDGDFVSFMVLFLSTCVVYFIMRRASMRDWVLDHYTSALPNCFSATFELCDRRWRTS